jgi:hypothetical protein
MDEAKGKTDKKSKKNLDSGMIDFKQFQKALIRIAALS